MARVKGKTKIEKLEKKLKDIKSGKWVESEERIGQLKDELAKLKQQDFNSVLY